MNTLDRGFLTAALLNDVRNALDHSRQHSGDPENLNCIVPKKDLTALRQSLTAFEAAHPHFIPEPDYD